MNKTHITALAFTSLFCAIASASPVDLYYQNMLQARTVNSRAASAVTEQYFRQMVDHQTPGAGTFNQRYYLDESYAVSKDAPVFLVLCGEYACHATILDGSIREMAQKYHARLIALEHRYYGKSLPRPSLSTANLKYLSGKHVLPDIARFIKVMSVQNNWSGKWITFGGSYAGTLSAFAREQLPELVAGSLASSAPVHATRTFPEFDEHVSRIAGQECADNMRKVTSEIEAALPDNTRMTEIKDMFHSSAIVDNTDFLSLVADLGAGAVQYGFQKEFCGLLAGSSTPLDGYATFAGFVFDMWGVDPVMLTPQGAMSEDPKDYEGIVGLRQWYYQSCTEFGGWQTASADKSKSVRSQLVNEEYYRNQCRRLFGLDATPDTDSLNEHYYKPLFNASASNIYFTNGSNDPWSLLSLADRNGNTSNKNLSYYMIDGAAHCDDLKGQSDNDSESLKQARARLDELLGNWTR